MMSTLRVRFKDEGEFPAKFLNGEIHVRATIRPGASKSRYHITLAPEWQDFETDPTTVEVIVEADEAGLEMVECRTKAQSFPRIDYVRELSAVLAAVPDVMQILAERVYGGGQQ